MLDTLALFDWLRLTLALLLVCGPGYALARWQPAIDRTQRSALAVGLALAFWPLLLAWLTLLDLPLSPLAVTLISLAGWGVALWTGPQLPSTGQPGEGRGNRLALWAVLLLTLLVQIWALRAVVVGPGSDSHHHTLFAQVIAERGGLPDDLLPLTPVASFTYHPGFHSVVALILWLTGLPAVVLMPLIGQVLKMAAALTTAYCTEIITGDRRAALISAAVVGLIGVFPTYYVNWGRATQLLGFVLVPIVLALVWPRLCERSADHAASSETTAGLTWRTVGLVALLCAGVALAHYRVTVMTALGVVLGVAIGGLSARWPLTVWGHWFIRLAGLALGAILLFAPWVWHLLRVRTAGYPVDVGEAEIGVFQLARLGEGVLIYPTNGPLLGLVALAGLWGLWRRERLVLLLLLWSLLLYWLSGPALLGIFLDTITVVTTLYFPAAVLVGWGLAQLYTGLAQRYPLARGLVIVGVAALIVQGTLAISTVVDPAGVFVGPDDLPALAWIRDETPESAYFMVNTIHFDFHPNYIVGADAGWWIPVLAGRRTIAAPMTYPIERNQWPDYVERSVALDGLGGDLTSPTALALLAREGVTHVYVGQRGGQIDVAALLNSPAYEVAYQNGAAYVFRFVGEP
jgi:hypothetical protein